MSATVPGSNQQLRSLVRPTIVVTFFSFIVHATNFIIQILVARIFGAGSEVDAFFAAATLPQYVTTVFLGTLAVVFIPVISAQLARREENAAAKTTTGVLMVSLITMAIVTAIGIAFASPLLRIATPGLSATSHALAVRLAWILWPGVLASVVVTVTSAAAQARNDFAWPAAAPLIGGVINLGVVAALHPRWGISAVATGQTMGLFVQALLLWRRRARPESADSTNNDGAREVFQLAWPLIVSGLLIRANVVLERLLASELTPGSIAHVSYALRIATLLNVLISTGLATTILPRLSRDVAMERFEDVARDVSAAFRAMWVAVAPVIGIGAVIATPVIAVAFERGRFTTADTTAVSSLLRIYLFILIGGCMGVITGRLLYALKLAKTLAVIGAMEGAVYALYTTLLVWRFGVIGLPLGFAIYYTGSLAWQMVVLRRYISRDHSLHIASAIVRTALAATLGAFAASLVLRTVSGAWVQTFAAGIAGLAVYSAALAMFNAPDARLALAAIRNPEERTVA